MRIAFLLRYPASWLAVGIVVLAHAALAWWFPLRGMSTLLLFAVDVVLLSLWSVMAVRSVAFRRFQASLPRRQATRELRRVIADCGVTFRTAATDCLRLMLTVAREFEDAHATFSLDDLMTNLLVVANKYRELERRQAAFGTEEQRQQMEHDMARQVAAVQGVLKSLEDLSGNLTLLEADTERSTRSLQDLAHANAVMREIIEEVHDGSDSQPN